MLLSTKIAKPEKHNSDFSDMHSALTPPQRQFQIQDIFMPHPVLKYNNKSL